MSFKSIIINSEVRLLLSDSDPVWVGRTGSLECFDQTDAKRHTLMFLEFSLYYSDYVVGRARTSRHFYR